jgi:HlyD family secretion protein
VVIAVDNADQVLMPGMTAYVSITIDQRKDALLAPNAALRFRPSETGARTDKTRSEKSKDTKPQDAKQQEGRKGMRGKDKGEGSAPTGTVYVLENGQPKPVRITTGITDNRFTEVVAGDIKEGAAVIVEDKQPPAKTSASSPMRLF